MQPVENLIVFWGKHQGRTVCLLASKQMDAVFTERSVVQPGEGGPPGFPSFTTFVPAGQLAQLGLTANDLLKRDITLFSSRPLRSFIERELASIPHPVLFVPGQLWQEVSTQSGMPIPTAP